MEARQIRLVEATFEKVVAADSCIVATFHEELRVFDAALSAQLAASVAEASVLTTVQAIIVGLRRPDRILEPAQKLAIKALDYGALSQNMTFVGNALLRTLKRRLGEDYTPEVRDAWIGAYRLVADAMRDAALGRGWRRAA